MPCRKSQIKISKMKTFHEEAIESGDRMSNI